MKTFREAWMSDGIADPFEFQRQCAAWVQNPVTVRFMVALETMRVLHLDQIAKPIKNDENAFNHNQNVHKSEVYREVVALCEGLHGKSGGAG